MRTTEGYIMLWRSIQESSVWNNAKPEALKVAIYLMLNARFKNGDWITKQGDVIHLKKGQVVIGRIQASSDCHMSEQNFRTCLKFLKKIGFLTIETTNRYTIVNICKYGTYQSSDNTANQHINQPLNQHLTSDQPALNQHLTTNNNVDTVKTVKNDGYTADFEEFWKAYPKKIGKGLAYTSFQKAKKSTTIGVMLKAIEQHKTCDQWCKDNGQFIPHPSTWLNQRRWDDETNVSEPQSSKIQVDYNL